MDTTTTTKHREPWNKGKLVGQKAPLRPKDIWAIRVRLQMQHRVRELALFNLGFDSKLSRQPPAAFKEPYHRGAGSQPLRQRLTCPLIATAKSVLLRQPPTCQMLTN